MISHRELSRFQETGNLVSIFACNSKTESEEKVAAARNGMRRLKESEPQHRDSVVAMPRLQAFPGDRLLMLVDTIICNARATVRHPYVLGVVETTETASGMIYVVTERVSVLSDVLNGCTPSGIAWGLYTTLTAVSFLNKECQLVHGNVSRRAPERAPPNPPSRPTPSRSVPDES
jgi:hypothetical protein